MGLRATAIGSNNFVEGIQRQPYSLPTRPREGRGGDDGAGGRSQVWGCARRQSVQTTSLRGFSVNLTRCLLARARGVAVMMVPAAGARYGVARDGNRFKQLR